MDIKLFTTILKDKHLLDYKKLKYKYSENFDVFLSALTELYCKSLPIVDFAYSSLIFIENQAA